MKTLALVTFIMSLAMAVVYATPDTSSKIEKKPACINYQDGKIVGFNLGSC